VTCLESVFVSKTDSRALGAIETDPTTEEEFLLRISNIPDRSVLQWQRALEIAWGWPANQLVKVKALFQKLDIHHTGRLDKAVICQELDKLGVPLKRASQAADAMDLGHEGSVGWTEFVGACLPVRDQPVEERCRAHASVGDTVQVSKQVRDRQTPQQSPPLSRSPEPEQPAAALCPTLPRYDPHQDNLKKLESMGFQDMDKNLAALRRNGNQLTEEVLEELLR